jgi:hypothetical protein
MEGSDYVRDGDGSRDSRDGHCTRECWLSRIRKCLYNWTAWYNETFIDMQMMFSPSSESTITIAIAIAIAIIVTTMPTTHTTWAT